MEKKQKNNEQGLTEKFRVFEQRLLLIQKQLQVVEQAILDLSLLETGLDEIKEGKEIFAPLGRGLFAEAKLTSEKIIVEIGEGNHIKKSIPQTKKLIAKQVQKLNGAKEKLTDELKRIDKELVAVMEEQQHKSDKQ